jgi:hypothetical protein
MCINDLDEVYDDMGHGYRGSMRWGGLDDGRLSLGSMRWCWVWCRI